MEHLLNMARPQLNVRRKSRDSRLSRWFGEQFPTYASKTHSGTEGADGTPIPVHGIRTICLLFKMLPAKDVAVGITLTVCDAQEPIISFSQML